MRIVFKLGAVLLLAACAASGLPDTGVPEQSSAASELPLALHWMRNSAEYRAAVLQTYAVAGDRLRAIAANLEKGTWAVAIDADETVLDNSTYARELVEKAQRTTDERWGEWVSRRAAPPVPGAVEFLELVHRLGGRIAVVTNRRAEHCADTEANFRAFEVPFDVILCRQEDRRKEARWRAIEEGRAIAGLPPLRILLWLGDNIEDFPELDQAIRQEGSEAFREFGRRYFVIPNPTYGSWLENPHG